VCWELVAGIKDFLSELLVGTLEEKWGS